MRTQKNSTAPKFWMVMTPGKPECDFDLFGFSLPAGKLTEDQLMAFLLYTMDQHYPKGMRFQLKNAQRKNRFMKFWLAKNAPEVLKKLNEAMDIEDEEQKRRDMRNFNKLF